jgi:hypothetical protein
MHDMGVGALAFAIHSFRLGFTNARTSASKACETSASRLR